MADGTTTKDGRREPVVPFAPVGRKPDEDTVEAIREALSLAEAGELRSVAIIGSLPGNRTYTNFQTEDFIPLVGMMTYIQHTVMARIRETSVDAVSPEE